MRTTPLLISTLALAACQQRRAGTYEGKGRFEGLSVTITRGADGQPVLSDEAGAPSKAVVTVTKGSGAALTFDVNGWCTLELGLSRDSLTAKTARTQRCEIDGELQDVKATVSFTPENDMTLSVSTVAYGAEPRSYKFEGKLAR